jgi:hypothetical protein
MTETQTPTGDAVELFLDSQYNLHRARERRATQRLEMQLSHPQPPQGQPDVVTLKDVIVYLLAMILLLAVLGRMA